MKGSNESALGGIWNPVGALVVVALVLCGVLGGFVWLRINVNHSLDRADGFELTQRLKRWVESGKPEEKRLYEFMQGRRADIVATNRVFSIGGTNFVTQFAVTKPKSGRTGILFVTTNEVLIWLDSLGRAQLFSIGPPPRR